MEATTRKGRKFAQAEDHHGFPVDMVIRRTLATVTNPREAMEAIVDNIAGGGDMEAGHYEFIFGGLRHRVTVEPVD